MQEVAGLVSIVIPAYNAGAFLPQVISSVKSQTYSPWEIIIVNDGSSDDTGAIAAAEPDLRVQVINQDNGGVSVARNRGLAQVRGEFIVFLDADDLLAPDFLVNRVDFLNENKNFGFVGGMIETFPEKTTPKKAVAEDPETEILFFDAGTATIPSNYMFRSRVLSEAKLGFNQMLNSTADRFFLLQVARITKGYCLNNKEARLLYRVNPNSMSHQVSPALILDNEKFYKELLDKKMLPSQNKQNFKSQYFYSLALGFAKVHWWIYSMKYFAGSFFASPVKFAVLLGSTIKKQINP